MKNQDQRINQIEERINVDDEPQFFSWIGHPWTEEEKAEALRQNPECRFFWRRLSSTPTTEEINAGLKKGTEPSDFPRHEYNAIRRED